MPHIRSYIPDDLPILYKICLETANNGSDASDLYFDKKLPGHLYVGPYLELSPAFGLCLVNDTDMPIGYCIATPNTQLFVEQASRHYFPKIAQQYQSVNPSRFTQYDHNIYKQITAFSYPLPSELDAYPAHLHIDILPAGHGAGWGKKLMQAQCALLQNANVQGVHLGVDPNNKNAIGFYQHFGFHPIENNAHQNPTDCIMLGMML